MKPMRLLRVFRKYFRRVIITLILYFKKKHSYCCDKLYTQNYEFEMKSLLDKWNNTHPIHFRCALLCRSSSMAVAVSPPRQGLYSLSGKTSYRKISWSLEAAIFGFKLFQSLWNLAGTSAAEVSVKFQSDTTIATSNLAASRLHEIWR